MPVRSAEKDIHKFLAAHPYLIDARFKGARTETEISAKGGRLDILIQKGRKHTIVELKKVALDESAIVQLEDYVAMFADKFKLTSYHYLVGKSPKDIVRFKKRVALASFKIHIRLLGLQIPLSFAFDEQTRCYQGASPGSLGNPVSFIL
ncbi:MAG: DUF91 domain-containing protein [Leptospirales bacterium]|nr:DUF91 domain-containing protein [Leptospirales bacterium]